MAGLIRNFKNVPPPSDAYYIVTPDPSTDVSQHSKYFCTDPKMNIIRAITLCRNEKYNMQYKEIARILEIFRSKDTFCYESNIKIRGNFLNSYINEEPNANVLDVYRLFCNDIKTVDDIKNHNKQVAKVTLSKIYSGDPCYLLNGVKFSNDYLNCGDFQLITNANVYVDYVIEHFENILENGYYKTK